MYLMGLLEHMTWLVVHMMSCEQGLVLSGAWDEEGDILLMEADKIAFSPYGALGEGMI